MVLLVAAHIDHGRQGASESCVVCVCSDVSSCVTTFHIFSLPAFSTTIVSLPPFSAGATRPCSPAGAGRIGPSPTSHSAVAQSDLGNVLRSFGLRQYHSAGHFFTFFRPKRLGGHPHTTQHTTRHTPHNIHTRLTHHHTSLPPHLLSTPSHTHSHITHHTSHITHRPHHTTTTTTTPSHKHTLHHHTTTTTTDEDA